MLAQVAQLSQRNRASLRYISHRRNFEVLSTQPVALPQAGPWASCCNIPLHSSHFAPPSSSSFSFLLQNSARRPPTFRPCQPTWAARLRLYTAIVYTHHPSSQDYNKIFSAKKRQRQNKIDRKKRGR